MVTLTRDVLSRAPDAPPLTTQLADHLRQAIASHDLEPGDPLPGQHRIADAVGVSRPVVQAALAVLLAEGLLERPSGLAYRVAQPPPVRELDPERYARRLAALRAGLPADPELEGWSADPYEVGRETATALDQEYLGVRKGAVILRRRMVERIYGVPVQIRRSAMPWALGSGPLAMPGGPLVPGAIAELYLLNLEPDEVMEETTSRPPNRLERDLLAMPTPTPVTVTVTVFYRDGRPLEASRTIMPANRVRFRFRMPL